MLITLLVTAFAGLKAIGTKGQWPFADKDNNGEAYSGNEGEH
jgi:hypothetical protein